MSDSATLELVAEALAREPLADRGQLLKSGGRRELLEEMARLRDRGWSARVLLLSHREPLDSWRGLWDQLSLDSSRDLLLIFNGRRWQARGWGLEPETIARALDRAEPELRVYYARGLVAALQELATEVDPALVDDGGLPIALPLTAGGLLAAGALAWVLRRRVERQRHGEDVFRQALAAAREAFTEVILNGDDVAFEDVGEAERIQLRAAELEQELDQLEREVASDSQRGAQAVTLGRVQHVHDELRVLASTVLQRRS